MPDDPQSVIDSLIRDQIRALEVNLNRRLDEHGQSVTRRFDRQDVALRDIKAQTTATNGRVSALEKARERAQGVMFAFRWMPPVLTACITAGLTILIMALTGGIH